MEKSEHLFRYPLFSPAMNRRAERKETVNDPDFDGPGFGTRDRMAGAVADVKDKVSDAVDHATDRVAGAAGAAREATGEALHSAAEHAQHLGRVEQNRSRSAVIQGRKLMADTPLAVGLAALALGALVGASIPETDREDQLFGETRDRLAGQARDAAREGVDRARDIAGAAATAATDAAKQELHSTSKEATSRSTSSGLDSTSPDLGSRGV